MPSPWEMESLMTWAKIKTVSKHLLYILSQEVAARSETKNGPKNLEELMKEPLRLDTNTKSSFRTTLQLRIRLKSSPRRLRSETMKS